MSASESSCDRAPSVELIARAKTGDHDAAAELYARYADKIRAFIRSRLQARLRPRVGSADVHQDAFSAAFDSLARFEYRGPGSFLHWVKKITKMRILALEREHLAAAKRDARKEVPLATSTTGQEPPWQADAASPSSLYGRGERADMIAKLMDRLPPDYAEMLRLVFWEKLKVKDAAARMGRSSGAGEKLLARALAKCQALTQDQDLRP